MERIRPWRLTLSSMCTMDSMGQLTRRYWSGSAMKQGEWEATWEAKKVESMAERTRAAARQITGSRTRPSKHLQKNRQSSRSRQNDRRHTPSRPPRPSSWTGGKTLEGTRPRGGGAIFIMNWAICIINLQQKLFGK